MPRVPRLLSGPNVKSLNLSPAEAYLLSRVDGMLDEHDLALVTGMTPPEAAEVLERLAMLGAIELIEPVQVSVAASPSNLFTMGSQATPNPGLSGSPVTTGSPTGSNPGLPGSPHDGRSLPKPPPRR